jgi:hypothetical protein
MRSLKIANKHGSTRCARGSQINIEERAAVELQIRSKEHPTDNYYFDSWWL